MVGWRATISNLGTVVQTVTCPAADWDLIDSSQRCPEQGCGYIRVYCGRDKPNFLNHMQFFLLSQRLLWRRTRSR